MKLSINILDDGGQSKTFELLNNDYIAGTIFNENDAEEIVKRVNEYEKLKNSIDVLLLLTDSLKKQVKQLEELNEENCNAFYELQAQNRELVELLKKVKQEYDNECFGCTNVYDEICKILEKAKEVE